MYRTPGVVSLRTSSLTINFADVISARRLPALSASADRNLARPPRSAGRSRRGRLQPSQQRGQFRHVLADPAGSTGERDGHAGVYALARRGGMLSNVEDRFQVQDSVGVCLARYTAQEATFAAVEGHHDLRRNVIEITDGFQRLGRLAQARDGIQSGHDGKIGR